MARRGENIYLRKDGRWEGRYIKGRKANSRPQFGYVYGKKYSEVKTKLLPFKYQYSRQDNEYSGFHGTLSDWIHCWLEGVVKSDIKQSTYAYYHGILQRYVLPGLGQMNLDKLTQRCVQAFIESLSAKGLGFGTVHGIFRILNRLLKKAVDDRILLINPCKDVILPKTQKPQVRALTASEQQKLEHAAVHDKDGIAVILALYTGMRIGEICALRWSDVDLQEGVIHVRQTVQRIPCFQSARSKTKVVFDTPKSAYSDRLIPLPLHIRTLLSDTKDKARNDYVVPCKNSFAEPRVVGYRFGRILKKAGLEHIHFHALRHTFATRFMEIGIDVTTLSRLLGHASVKMTLDTYTDSLMEHKKAAMHRLNSLYSVHASVAV